MLTSQDLLESLGKLKLVDQLDLSVMQRDDGLRQLSPRELARELIAQDLITPYQVNQLFVGNGENLLLGSYVLLQRLGEGGMGQVFVARNWKLARVVALKMIRSEQLASPDVIRRFLREIQAVSQLSHPNIVHAFDAEEADGKWFLAMELVEGQDLRQLLAKNGSLPVKAACDFIRQAALGLQHAHEQGLVHRDIKPSNLLVSAPKKKYPHGQVKILDLGLALFQTESEDESMLTIEGTIMGTPDYLAPEQGEESHNVDIRADIYSLGCSFYHLLCGEPPFAGGSFAQKIRKHLTTEPIPIENRRSDVTREIGGVLRKMMRKSPDDRQQTPLEVALELEAAMIPKAEPVRTATSISTNPFEEIDDTIPQHNPETPSKKALWWVLSSLLAAMILGGLFLLTRGEPAQPARTNPDSKSGDPREMAEKRIAEIERRATGKEDQSKLRMEILQFRQKYYRFADLCVRASTLLSDKIPSPLDELPSIRKIEGEKIRNTTSNCELVQILGDERWKAWGGNTLSINHEGNRIACGTRLGFQIWDEEGKSLHYQEVSGGVRTMQFSPVSNLLALVSRNGVLSLWQIPESRRVMEFPKKADGVLSFAFSKDGKRLAFFERRNNEQKRADGWIRIIEIATQKIVSEWAIPLSASSLAFLPDGDGLVSSGNDGTVRIWSIKKQARIATPHKTRRRLAVRCVAALSSRPTILWAGDNGNLAIYHLTPKKRVSLSIGWRIQSFKVSPDESKVVLFGQRSRAAVVDLTRQAILFESPSHAPGNVDAAVFLGSGSTVMSLSAQGTKHRWYASTGKLIPVTGHTSTLNALSVSPDDSVVATSSTNHRVMIWNLIQGKKSAAFISEDGFINDVSISPTDEHLAVVIAGGTKIWSRKKAFTGDAYTLLNSSAQAQRFAFSPSGRECIQTKINNGSLRIYALRFNTEKRVLMRKDDPFTGIAYSPGGDQFAAGTVSGKVIPGEVATGKTREMSSQGDLVYRVAFHPTGKILATGSRNCSIWVRDVETGKVLQKVGNHTSEVRALVFSPNGRWLASASGTNELFLWRVEAKRLKLASRFHFPGRVADVAFASDSRHLLTANANGVAYLLRLFPNSR